MKKWPIFILLLIVTTGVFVPCCSLDDCCADRVSSAAKTSTHQDEGTCSPFFACATCPGFVLLSKPIQLAEPVVEKIVHHPVIAPFHLSSFTSSFWQPPRVC